MVRQQTGESLEMHERLFANQQQLQPEALPQHAQAIGLDVPAFQACLDSGKYTKQINDSLKAGQSAGVRGTPAFLLGYTQANGEEVKAVKFLSGALPFDTFRDNSCSTALGARAEAQACSTRGAGARGGQAVEQGA